MWHHRLLDFEKWRTAILVGLLLLFLLLVTFVATTDQAPGERIGSLPAFGNVRWFGYYAAAAVGLAAPGFLRGDKTALVMAAAAFAVAAWTGSRGALIAAVASACYAATWQVAFFNFYPDYLTNWQAKQLERDRARGVPEAELEKSRIENARWAELYRNPAINFAITFTEPLPVAVLAVLVSAGALSRRRREPRVVARGAVLT